MKYKALGEVVRQGLSAAVDVAQKEPVLIMRHGKPAALLIGVEGKGLEQIAALELDRIARLEPSYTLAEVIQELGGDRSRKGPAHSSLSTKPKRKKRAGRTASARR
jgi:PHD/YefM family antitoxin component YafN of YafNO toxin-antitoxin module